MQATQTSLFKSEVKGSPKPVFALALLLGLLIYLGTELLSISWEEKDVALTLYLCLFFFAISGWMVDEWNTLVGRWYTFAGMVCILFITSQWFKVPEIMLLEVFPVAILAITVSFPAAVLSTIGEIIILFILPQIPYLDIRTSTVVITSLGLLSMLGLIFAIYQPLNHLTQWLSAYFEESQRYLHDARQRKVELEQAAQSVANANRQLVLANKKMAMLSNLAEEAQKAKTIFVASVSHEFRTPLNMIIGLIDLMMRSPEIYDVVFTPKMQDDLSVIYRNCEHLSNMINDVLDLTRIETGRLALFREWVDLEEIIKRGISVVRPLLDTKNISIELAVSSNLPKLFLDRIRLQQVILNLLSNAARFTEVGGISVKVSQESSKVLVEVADTGPGIAPDNAKRIFEPFWQGNEPIWQAKGGSGLGLSLSKEFIQLHGGRMWFNSSPGLGSSFFFTVPILSPEDTNSNPIQYVEDWLWKEDSFKSSRISSSDVLVKPRTLIFDESEILYPRFQRYSDQIDFINLKDLCHLPKMNLAQAIVLNSESDQELLSMMNSITGDLPVTPIIGCKVGREIQRALDLGAKGYLVKPVLYESLKKSLEPLNKPVHNVLIVDDDPEIQNLFSRMITVYNQYVQIKTASSGQEALDILKKICIDVMLLDLVMPGMSGWQVLENWNELQPKHEVDTLIITAQDPADQTVSDYVIATIKGGIPMDKVFRLSLEIPRLLMEPGLTLDPVP